MSNSIAILAAAGSRKTEHIVESALATDGRVLIATYTNENRCQIVRRIEQKVGAMPPNITVMGWFSFLIAQCAKPYQRALTKEPLLIRGLNFKGQRNRFTKKEEARRYFLDAQADFFRDAVSDFVVCLNNKTSGAVIGRLERVFTHIFVDEMQDLAGYDLDVLELLIRSKIALTVVGDPRQCTLTTNTGARHKKYRGAALADWLSERADVCRLETRTESYRCNQALCDFADAIFPAMPRTTSVGVPATDHDGVFEIKPAEVHAYVARYSPVDVLRHDRTVDTMGLPAVNIGIAKGSTLDRVLIFPTKPMLAYLKDRNPAKLKAPERLYVAVTRARFSVAFVVPPVR